MQELRLLGIHDDGKHLLLGDKNGLIYKLLINESLRIASSKKIKKTLLSTSEDIIKLTPRDIQRKIRSGATAETIASTYGSSLKDIQKYEGPVLAEREYIAQQARNSELSIILPRQKLNNNRNTSTNIGSQKSLSTLEEVVLYRLTELGVSIESIKWDSWKLSNSTWCVIVSFYVKKSIQNNDERQYRKNNYNTAKWIYNPNRKTLDSLNKWSESLSKLGKNKIEVINSDDKKKDTLINNYDTIDLINNTKHTINNDDKKINSDDKKNINKYQLNNTLSIYQESLKKENFQKNNKKYESIITEKTSINCSTLSSKKHIPSKQNIDNKNNYIKNSKNVVCSKDFLKKLSETSQKPNKKPNNISNIKNKDIKCSTNNKVHISAMPSSQFKKTFAHNNSDDSSQLTSNYSKSDNGKYNTLKTSTHHSYVKELKKNKQKIRRQQIPSWEEIVFGSK